MSNKIGETKSMFTVETKSMLAKLMATENIKVEHRNCKTAGFNLKTRTLICPIWKDMSGDLYDMLMGHEISHALRTPVDGWHDSVVYAGGDKKASPEAQRAFKHFLNVAEDARIEKLVKRQYPGIRRPMVNAYKELLAKDFFGLSAITNFNELYLIDKLNLAAKCGTLVNIRFYGKEKALYDEMMGTETWDEVVAFTRKVYEYSKEEQQQGEQKRKELADHLKEMYEQEQAEEDEQCDDDEDSYSFEGEGDDEDGEEGEDGDSDGESDEDEDGEDGDGKGEDGEDGEEGDGKKSKSKGENAKDDKEKKADDKAVDKKKDDGKGNRSKKSDSTKPAQVGEDKGQENSNEKGDFVPKAKTDEAFRAREERLIEKTKTESYYVNIPLVTLKDVVAPAEIVNRGLTYYYAARKEEGYKLFNEFKKKNEDYISLLAKEFEMKKAARSYAKAKISDSGDININKLANYRMEDNIFKKMIQVHKGKSHGLVLILDKSGSMHQHIEGAMEQILVMALFCRKVNIPFVAYSFTSSGCGSMEHDFPGRGHGSKNPLRPFSKRPLDMIMGNLELREMFNSKMPASEFTQSIMNHLMVAKALSSRQGYSAPNHERMGGTPLNEALVALRDLIRQFKGQHRLDIVNAVVVHDGDSDGNSRAFAENSNTKGNEGDHSYSYNTIHFHPEINRLTLVDTKEKIQIDVPKESRGLTIALMKWIQMTADCGVFGFYITGATASTARGGIMNLFQNEQGIKLEHVRKHNTNEAGMLIDKLCREVIEKKFLESWTSGYTRFYFIPGSVELKTENLQMVENGKGWTPSRLLTAFKRVNRRKQVSRVLVNKFIELIAV
jgi:uncharacterized protein YlaN (UPF0358 family)